jgi:predicted esterase
MRSIDPRRIALAGFSDGASYALSLGLRNGDLFAAALGFSAGFLKDEDRYGKPPVFLAHGSRDPYFPVDACGRRIQQQLKREGYRVTYRELPYAHVLPPEVAAEGMNWFMELPR